MRLLLRKAVHGRIRPSTGTEFAIRIDDWVRMPVPMLTWRSSKDRGGFDRIAGFEVAGCVTDRELVGDLQQVDLKVPRID